MRIRRKFLQLTRKTFPYGYESELVKYLPDGSSVDEHGNYFYIVGDNPTTMFTCHLDTACDEQKFVKHVYSDRIIKTDGTTILGADDKAGMVVLLYMIEKKVPGLYYFFIGEEVGCIGSSKLAEDWENFEYKDSIKKVVSFDRRGTKSVITHQLYGRCCSDEFAEELSFRLNTAGYDLNLEPDDTGIMTDSAKFIDLVPECTNISVGYYKEHTYGESQDIEYLTRLCRSVVLIDWETLPVERDPYINYEYYEEEYDAYNYGNYDNGRYFSPNNWTWVNTKTGVKKMYISSSQIDKEKSMIYSWLFNSGLYHSVMSISWNGNTLYIENQRGDMEYVGGRMDVCEMVPDLKFISSSQLSDKPTRKSNLLFGRVQKKEFLM
jgi:hypothetical protein